jgi:gluconate:H+ symporter, GntP family
MFFEIGLVLLIPVILLITRRSGLPLMRIGIPALAGLSVMHGLVPPHPGPLIAIAAVHANLGFTLGLGILVAIPTVVVAGPLFSGVTARWVPVDAPALFDKAADDEADDSAQVRRRPSFGVTLATVLLPVVLMLGKAVYDIAVNSTGTSTSALDFLGTPLIALLITALVAIVTLGRGAGLSMSELADSVSNAFPPIAGITFIVAAGGDFKQVLIDSGIANVVQKAVEGSSISALFLAWLVAVGIRLATGSATVATITASGILSGVAGDLSTGHTALLVLAIGSGSLFFSHVNDAGFWLVKEYFGLTVGETIKSWSVMETVISVVGFALVMVLSIVV